MHSSHSTTQKKWRDIVVVGDGPAALFLAIKLKQKGINKVTLVGPRLGEFTRGGNVDPRLFTKLNTVLTPHVIQPTETRHIKEIERQLFAIVESLAITTIKKKFVAFAEQQMLQLTDDNDQPHLIHADLVFDCTGTRREVIQQFNARTEEGPRFTVQRVGDLPTRKHAVFHLLTDKIDLALTNINKLKYNPKAYVLTLEALRQVGWPEDSLPTFYAHQFRYKRNPQYAKQNLYLSVPLATTTEEAFLYMQTLLTNYARYFENHPYFQFQLRTASRKYPRKSAFSLFTVDPKQTSPVCYPGDNHYPFVMHAGDATADLPFFTGSSFYMGIERSVVLIEQLMVNQGGDIEAIDQAGLNVAHAAGLASHLRDGIERAKNREDRLSHWNGIEEQVECYQQAYAETLDPMQQGQIKIRLDQLLLSLYSTLSSRAFKANEFKKVIEYGTLFVNRVGQVASVEEVKSLDSIHFYAAAAYIECMKRFMVKGELDFVHFEQLKKMALGYLERISGRSGELRATLHHELSQVEKHYAVDRPLRPPV